MISCKLWRFFFLHFFLNFKIQFLFFTSLKSSDYFSRYFFFVLTALIILGLFNGLVFLPVLLVMLGPPGKSTSLVWSSISEKYKEAFFETGEVIPNDRGDAIAPPSPEFQPSSLGRQRSLRTSNRPYPSIRMSQSQGQGQSQGQPPQMTQLTNSKRHNSDLSLSTIAEESNSYSSSSHSFCCPNKTPECSRRCPAAQLSSINGASVIVEPHVTVETTTYVSLAFTTSFQKFRLSFSIHPAWWQFRCRGTKGSAPRTLTPHVTTPWAKWPRWQPQQSSKLRFTPPRWQHLSTGRQARDPEVEGVAQGLQWPRPMPILMSHRQEAATAA